MRHLIWLPLAFVLGCSQLQKRPDGGTQPSVSGAPTLEPAPLPETTVPQLAPQSPKKIVLILGAGGARTLAHAGIIRALVREKIEIAQVSGVEWASLAAASFAVSGQIHDMDWKLYKLDALDLKVGSGFFGLGGKKTIQDLSEYFDSNFGKNNVDSSKVRFSCMTQVVGAGGARIVDRGSMSEGLKQCIPYPPFFEIGKNAAGAAATWNLIKSLKRNSDEVVVFIDVLGTNVLNDPQIRKDKVTTLLWSQVIESNQMVKALVRNAYTVTLDRYSVFDFSNRKTIEEAGEKAGAEIARRLKEQYAL